MGGIEYEFACHKLHKLTGSRRPVNLLFFDTETKQKQVQAEVREELYIFDESEYFLGDESKAMELHRMKIAWTCFCNYDSDKKLHGDTWKFWTDTKKVNEYFMSLTGVNRTLFLFGHNIFFDLQASDFFHYFTKWGWVLDFSYDKGLCYILVIRKGRRTIKCISTTNYFDESLEKLGKFLGVRKIGIDFRTASDTELKRYCKRDVNIIRLLMKHYLEFIDRHDLGKFAMAKGGQAFTAWRYRFMDTDVFPHSHAPAQKLEQKAYLGGRVETLHLGKLPDADYVSVDVNSLYSSVMTGNTYPVKLIGFAEKPDIKYLKNCLNSYCCVAECHLETDEPAYGIRKNYKLIFPKGKFTAFLCTAGLRYALERGHIKSIKRLSVYLAEPLFTEYVKYFANLKEHYGKQDNKIMRKFTKYMQNTLYGKFGQREDLIEYELDIDYKGYYREQTYDTVTKKIETVTKLFNKFTMTYGSQLCKNSFVAIAAHITENARFYLYSLMRKIGLRKCLYVDTDSLKFRSEYLDRLKGFIDPQKMGMLKVEDRFKQFEIMGAKYYRTENEFRMKGVPQHAEKTGEYTYRYTTFPKQATHLAYRVTRYFVTKQMTKTVKPHYDKGIVHSDGSVTPFVLDE